MQPSSMTTGSTSPESTFDGESLQTLVAARFVRWPLCTLRTPIIFSRSTYASAPLACRSSSTSRATKTCDWMPCLAGGGGAHSHAFHHASTTLLPDPSVLLARFHFPETGAPARASSFSNSKRISKSGVVMRGSAGQASKLRGTAAPESRNTICILLVQSMHHLSNLACRPPTARLSGILLHGKPFQRER